VDVLHRARRQPLRALDIDERLHVRGRELGQGPVADHGDDVTADVDFVALPGGVPTRRLDDLVQPGLQVLGERGPFVDHR
jgi:hypothetical protein